MWKIRILPIADQRRAVRGLGLLRERALEVAGGSVIGVHIEPWLAHEARSRVRFVQGRVE